MYVFSPHKLKQKKSKNNNLKKNPTLNNLTKLIHADKQVIYLFFNYEEINWQRYIVTRTKWMIFSISNHLEL